MNVYKKNKNRRIRIIIKNKQICIFVKLNIFFMFEPYDKNNKLPNYQIIITKMSKSYKNSLQKRGPHCPHCQNLNLPANHWLRKTADKTSELVCPVLLQTECQYCFELGHTVSHCKSIVKYKKKIAHVQTPSTTSTEFPRFSLLRSTIVSGNLQNNNNNTFAALIDDDEDNDVTIGQSAAISKGFGRKRCTMMVKPKCSPLHSEANHLMGATCQPRTLVEECQQTSVHLNESETTDSLKIYTTHREHDEPFMFRRRMTNWADDESDDE